MMRDGFHNLFGGSSMAFICCTNFEILYANARDMGQSNVSNRNFNSNKQIQKKHLNFGVHTQFPSIWAVNVEFGQRLWDHILELQ